MSKSMGGFLRFIFPSYCLGCLKDGPNYCCSVCLKQIEIFRDCCPLCNHPSAQGRVCGWCLRETSLDGLYIAAPYDQPLLPELLTAFKFESIRSLAHELGSLLSSLLSYCPKESILLPLPLSWWRLQERGFNQSELLVKSAVAGDTGAGTPTARSVSEHRWGAQVAGPTTALLRRRWAFKQSQLSAKERARNIRGKFYCPQPKLVYNQKIVLIDDLYTTGATLNEAAKTLKQAGAKQIIGLALAKG